MHCHTKRGQNLLNDCRHITFNSFQNGSHPPSWIFKNLNSSRTINVWRTNTHHHAKFHQNWQNGFEDIAIFDFQDVSHPPSWILKFSVTDWVGNLEGQICIVIPNFIKISNFGS